MFKFVKEFKAHLTGNGQTLKWFWKTRFNGELSYQYFIMQTTGHATLQPNVEDAILKYLKEVKNNEK